MPQKKKKKGPMCDRSKENIQLIRLMNIIAFLKLPDCILLHRLSG